MIEVDETHNAADDDGDNAACDEGFQDVEEEDDETADKCPEEHFWIM